MTQEFHISVTPVGDNEYLVRTEKVASGVPLAEEQVRWPVDEWLKHTRQLMNDPLLGVLEGQTLSRFRHPAERNKIPLVSDPPLLSLVELGQQLYQGLFQGTLRDSWTCAQAIAQNRDELLQIRLGVKGKRLSNLPWEVLHATDRPIATGTYIGFSRYQPGTSAILYNQVRHPHQPLKILMAIAAPTDQDTLQLKQEVLHLQEELRRDNKRNSLLGEQSTHNLDIQLTILEQPDREQLTQALEQGQYQIFHYAGHSNLGLSGGELYLVSNRTGLTETLSGDDLAGLLVNNGVQMVVLNSCRGAYGNTVILTEDTAQVNLAEALVKRGIPGVLAMAERIPDDVALSFTRLFYRNIVNQDDPIDIILNRVRQGLITSYGSDQLYWALPVLYLHREFDGYLTAPSTLPPVFEEKEIQAVPSQPVPTKPILKSPLSTPPLPEWDLMNDDDVEEFLDDLVYEDELNDDANATDFIGDVLRGLNPSDSPPPPPTVQEGQTPQSLFVSPTSPAPVSPEAKTLFPAQFKKWLWVLPLVILVPIGLGMWLFQSRLEENLTKSTPPPNLVKASENQPITLENANTGYVLGIAVEQFERRNLLAATEATTELLDRGALQEAKAALATVPVQDGDQATVHFLNGRLIWQSIQAGSIEYKIDEARRYWEKAVQKNPQSVEYKNALAFAYYTEGKLENAYQLWSQVLQQEEPTFVGKPEKEGAQVSNVQVARNQNDELTAYAGLGLVWRKFAQSLPLEKKEFMLSKAIKFSEKVRSENPTDFQPEQLSKNWMWSKEIIRDWQLLLKEQ